jgi:hypothetical protein
MWKVICHVTYGSARACDTELYDKVMRSNKSRDKKGRGQYVGRVSKLS